MSFLEFIGGAFLMVVGIVAGLILTGIVRIELRGPKDDR